MITEVLLEGGNMMDKEIKAILGGTIATAAAIIGAVLYIAMQPPERDSREWIEGLSDDEWETERERVRLDFCNPDLDDDTRIRAQGLLFLYDKIKSDRDWAGKEYEGPAYHREHGFGLYKDDD